MNIRSLLVLLLITLTASAPLNAQMLPRWELGVGAGVLNLPYYRGSDIYKNYATPFPYLIYRGDRINIDRSGIQGHLFRSDRIRLDLSIAAGIPVSSDGDSPRAGMPDLDTTIELGPSLEFNLWRNSDRRQMLWLKLPLRSAHSIGGDGFLKHRGGTFSPYLEIEAKSGPHEEWKASLSVGPLYADRDYHNYYYEVMPRYVTATRRNYHASGGYSGARTTLTVRKNLTDKLRLGAFARFDTLKDAEFEDSPLVSSKHYRAVGLALIWIFAESEEQVKTR